MVARFGKRRWCAELCTGSAVCFSQVQALRKPKSRLRPRCIRIAKEQKSVSLEKRAEETCAEYHRKSERVRRTSIPPTSLLTHPTRRLRSSSLNHSPLGFLASEGTSKCRFSAKKVQFV